MTKDKLSKMHQEEILINGVKCTANIPNSLLEEDTDKIRKNLTNGVKAMKEINRIEIKEEKYKELNELRILVWRNGLAIQNLIPMLKTIVDELFEAEQKIKRLRDENE